MRRRKKGQSLIEFVMATTLVIPVLLLFIDSFLMFYGMQLNQSICTEAVRSAACGDPRYVLLRAFRIVSNAPVNKQGTFKMSLVAAGTSVRKSDLESLEPYGGPVSGTVDVTTAVEVRPLLLGWFLGNHKSLRLQTSEEMPCMYVVPNASGTL